MPYILCFIALVKKEMRQLLKNPKSRFILIMPPLIQMVVLGYAATMDLTSINFAVLDHAHSYTSRQLTAKFTGNGIFKAKRPASSEKELAERISSREILMALVIPENFERRLRGEGTADAQILVDGRNSSTAGIAIGYAQSVAEQFNRQYRIENNLAESPLKLETRAWYNPNYNIRYFMIPALLAMIALLDVMLLTALSIAREREEGTFDQLLVAPYSPGALLAAKAITSIAVGLIQLSFCFLVAILWFRIPFVSSVPVLYCTFILFLFASVGIGLLISVFCSNLQQAMLGAFIVAVPFALLSGIACPIESMPDFFQYLVLINPISYGIKVLHHIFLEGAQFSYLWYPFTMMSVIGTGSLTLAYIIFRRQVRG